MKTLLKLILPLVLFLPLTLQAQTSVDEIIGDITLPHEGRPHGVPASVNWAQKPRVGAMTPQPGWTAAIAWGQLYEWIEGNPATNTRVQIKDIEMYYLSKADNKWHLLQKSIGVEGNAYVEDFSGDVNKPADKRIEKDGSVSVKAGGGYNFHFWSKLGRVKYPVNDVAGCYVTVKARLVVDNATLPDDRDKARYLMSVGGDWWLSLTAQWDQWKTNADMGIGRFRFVTPEWKSFNMVNAPLDSVRKNPPPFVAISTAIRQLPMGSPAFLNLEKIYPNPVAPATQVRFNLTESHAVNLSVFDNSGRKIESLLSTKLNAGDYSISWNTSHLPSGIYFIQLDNNDFGVTQRCQVIN